MDKDKIIKVKNRDNGRVGYTIPDMGNLYRSYMPGETKEITFEEIRKLYNSNGGRQILENHLVIEDEEVIKEIFGSVEPEYKYTEEEVKILLSNQGTLEQLEDTLKFAPVGVIELVKKIAVETELNDIRKREAILNKTGFDVTKAIEINRETKEEEEKKENSSRQAAPVTKDDANESGRKAAPVTSKYNVIK